MGRPVSRILFLPQQIMIISLGCRSPGTSRNLPGNFRRAALKRFPIWSCTRWGLPCLPCRHGSGELLPRHFNLTCACRSAGHRRCVFCGTFLRLPGVRVTNHRALWCSDFPPRPDDRSDHASAPTPCRGQIEFVSDHFSSCFFGRFPGWPAGPPWRSQRGARAGSAIL